MLFVTRACYIKSHFVDSIVECQLYTYPISLLFQFITHCATDIFHQGHVTQSFWIRILFHKYDTLTECYRVRWNSYRISYEREYISGFMGPSNIVKLLKIARAVGLLERIWSTLNVRHVNLRSNLILLLPKLFAAFHVLIQMIRALTWLIMVPSQFNILTRCCFTYRHQNHQVIFQESVDYYKRKTIYNTRPMYFEIINP